MYNQLLNYYNNTDASDSYHIIIEKILLNIDALQPMNISELADLCFTSPSTITRFCRYFDCDSFHSFKDSLRIRNFEDPRFLFRLNNDWISNLRSNPQEYIDSYAQEIYRAIEDTRHSFEFEQVDMLLKRLVQSKNIYIFARDASYELARTIQKDLLPLGILCIIFNSSKSLQNVLNLPDKDSLIVTISCFGNIFKHDSKFSELLLSTEAYKVLITQNPAITEASVFNETLCFSSQNHSYTGNYSMILGVEYLIRRCRILFDTKKDSR